MTWVKALNLCVLQWFGVRLARVLDDEGSNQIAWGLIGPVLPLSGWGWNYIGWPRIFVQWKV